MNVLLLKSGIREHIAASVNKGSVNKSISHLCISQVFTCIVLVNFENTWDRVSWENQHDW